MSRDRDCKSKSYSALAASEYLLLRGLVSPQTELERESECVHVVASTLPVTSGGLQEHSRSTGTSKYVRRRGCHGYSLRPRK